MADNFQRSCEHWSEAGRREMEDFYALASVDYRYLAQARDWKSWLETQQAQAGAQPLRLLDVACGSGKFPAALVRDANVASASVQPIDYALLDPSGFSIAEARQALLPPFNPGPSYETTLQALDCEPATFDIVWATHGLYALPASELPAALERFMHAMAERGTGFIAHACEDAHYLRFYRHYLDAFHNGHCIPYTSAEQIMAVLEQMGVSFEAQDIVYHNGAPETSTSQVEGYLQRCAFDNMISLDQMLAHPTTGDYLAGCRSDGQWLFSQRVMMILIRP